MPPGTAYHADEHAPEGVLYFRIFGVVFCLFTGALALAGGGIMVSPFFTHAATGSGPMADLGARVAGLLYGGIGLGGFIPTMIALFAGRRPWVHTLGTVVIGLGMFSLCCIPVLIPLLIAWLKVETRRWYGTT
jgi:hypothetical protein